MGDWNSKQKRGTGKKSFVAKFIEGSQGEQRG